MQSWITMRLAFKKWWTYIYTLIIIVLHIYKETKSGRYNIEDAYSYGGLVSFDSRLR